MEGRQFTDSVLHRLGRLALQAKVLKLEGNIKPRTITKAQLTNLISCLANAPEKGKINVIASILDAEATAFAEQICNILKSAGFEVHCPTEFTSDSTIMVGPPGFHISIKDPSKPFPRAKVLQECFLAEGINLIGLNSGDPAMKENEIEIIIGQR